MRGFWGLFVLAFVTTPAGAIPAAECGGQAVFQLEGDGVKTDRVRLWCKNTGKTPLTVEVPQGTVFSHPALQDLMVLEGRKLVVPPNNRVQCTLATMCVGQRGEKPPTSPATDFTAMSCEVPVPFVWRKFCRALRKEAPANIGGGIMSCSSTATKS